MTPARSKSSPTRVKRPPQPSTPATMESQPGPHEAQTQTTAGAVQKEDPRIALRTEIRTLRKLLQDKSAQLRSMGGGPTTRGESAVVTKALALLLRQEGATKDALVSETGAKKGYVDALLNRILPERGYSIIATPIEGSRQKSYRIQPAPTSA